MNRQLNPEWLISAWVANFGIIRRRAFHSHGVRAVERGCALSPLRPLIGAPPLPTEVGRVDGKDEGVEGTGSDEALDPPLLGFTFSVLLSHHGIS